MPEFTLGLNVPAIIVWFNHFFAPFVEVCALEHKLSNNFLQISAQNYKFSVLLLAIRALILHCLNTFTAKDGVGAFTALCGSICFWHNCEAHSAL